MEKGRFFDKKTDYVGGYLNNKESFQNVMHCWYLNDIQYPSLLFHYYLRQNMQFLVFEIIKPSCNRRHPQVAKFPQMHVPRIPKYLSKNR